MVRIAAAVIALAVSLAALAAHGSDEIVLLDFSSPTCGPCRQMEPLIRAYLQAGYPIRQVDTSQELELTRQYRIAKVPCFVMLVDGQEIHRVQGPVDGPQLEQMFDRAKEVYRSRHARKGPRMGPPAPPVSLAESETVDAPVDRGSHDAGPELPAQLLNATVRISVDDGQGRSFGTGTIIDARQGDALVITCGHLFRESKGRGPVQVELFEATSTGLRVVGEFPGEVIAYDLDRDVGLVSIRPDRPVTVALIAPRNAPVARGDRVVSIGCSNGQDPTVLASRITSLDRYQGPPNIEASGAPAVGRSGGGLFNEKGELVGVCYSADYEGNEGLYAPLESIHDELARLKLDGDATGAALAGTGMPASSPPSNTSGGPIVRGQGGQERQETTPIPMPPPEREPATLTAVTTAGASQLPPSPPTNLNPNEQAAWEEIMRRATEHEVIIIVRPKEPGGESEIINLNSVSPEFIRALEARRSQPGTGTR